jgi:potassium efflux system protein
VAALLALVSPFTAAQTPAPGALSQAQMEARLQEVDKVPGLDEGQRSRLADSYRQALAQLQAARTSAAAAAEYRDTVEAAPKELRSIRSQLASPEPDQSPLAGTGLSDRTPLAELEQRLALQKTELASAEARLADLDKAIQAEQVRPTQARQELTDARQALEPLLQELKAPAPSGEVQAVGEARRVMLQARIQARAEEIARLEQENASHAVRLELLGARRDLAAREISRLRDRVAALDSLLSQVRRAAAQDAVEQAAQAEQAAAAKHPVIRTLAEANAQSSESLARLTAEAERVSAAREATALRLAQIEQDFKGARQKLEAGGLSEVLGKLLMEQRDRLPYTRGRLQRLIPLPFDSQVELRERYGEVALAQVQVEEERRQIADIDRALDRLLTAPVGMTVPPQEEPVIRAELRGLLRDRQTLLQQLGAAQTALLAGLGELEFDRLRLINVIDDYRAFLDEHLLWIPSTEPVGAATLRQTVPAAAWLLSPSNWAQVALALRAAGGERPLAVVGGLLALAGLLWARRRPLRRRLAEIGSRIGKPTADRIGFTFEALAYTVLLALPVPATLWLLGKALRGSPEAGDFSQAVAGALVVAAPFLLNATTLLGLCAPSGPGALHFGWKEPALRLVRRQVQMVVTAGLPLVFVAATLGPFASEAHRDSLGRLAFVVLMVVWASVLQRILSPDGAVMRLYFNQHPRGYLRRLRFVWYPAAVGAALVLGGLALAGYYYSAGQLAVRVIDTLWLVTGAVVIQSLVARWLVVTRRRLALELARERRDTARASAGVIPEETAPAVPEPPEVNLAVLDAQTRQLLRTLILLAAPVGLWLVWADVLPALNVLERVTLWYQTGTVDGAERLLPVTLEDLALALLLGLIAVAAARNLPGLLEVVLLRYSELEPGSRYAIRKGVQYLLVAIGAALVLDTLGWSWSQIQWLVAALGVGLGFGLQEIVANFISGLIILFERPVRVGDTVTVGELSGTVTRIRIRATTITDWDRKEIIVPNKSFITERVVNWTLSDPITRVKVRVGVAYGSDIGLAHRLILEAVRAVPLVREDPPPQAFFVGFGESSLEFDVYAFASQLADRLPITHEVHLRVERKLRENGIEIPFPQRDVRIRGVAGAGSPPAVAVPAAAPSAR